MAAWRVNTVTVTIASVSMDMAKTAKDTKAARDTDIRSNTDNMCRYYKLNFNATFISFL